MVLPERAHPVIPAVVSPRGSSLSVDLSRLEWDGAPPKDELGAPIAADRVYRVRTHDELAAVLADSAERGHLVRPFAAASSSKSYISPPEEFMRDHGKTGITLVAFQEAGDSEFRRCEVDVDSKVGHFGAAISLAEQCQAVEEASGKKLEARMTITTMGAKAVATAMGSGGVADSSDSAFSLMERAKWMDGTGRIHEEFFRPGEYFDPETSSFYPVHEDQIAREMTGRGAPFGIGTEVSFKLHRRPLSVDTIIFPFEGTSEEIRARLAQFIVEMNRNAKATSGQTGAVQLRSLEIMDRNAMDVAREVSSWRPKFGQLDPGLIVIADFGSYDSTGILSGAFEAGFIPDDFAEREQFMVLMDEAAKMACRTFRLHGPDHLRKILREEYPGAVSESTDWAVDAEDPALVEWYFENFFALHDGVQSDVARQALYGHALNRLDFHHRKIFKTRDAAVDHQSRFTGFGLEVGELERAGKKVRVRGEKPELPFGESLETIGLLRGRDHQASNVRILRANDPHGLFIDKSPERWQQLRYKR